MAGGGLYTQGRIHAARRLHGGLQGGSVTCTSDGLLTPCSPQAAPLNGLLVQDEWPERAFQGQGWSEEPPGPVSASARCSVLSVTSNELGPEGEKSLLQGHAGE